MNNPTIRNAARNVQGSVAVEMAIVLPIMVTLITGLIWFAQVFWYYSVMQKAAYDAARLLSTATPIEVTTPGAGNTAAPIAQLVAAMVEERTSLMNNVEGVKYIDVQCDFVTCGFSVPTTVRVSIKKRISFPILEQSSLGLTADVTMRYAGN
jgi:Flp pilus assembly protein TadG